MTPSPVEPHDRWRTALWLGAVLAAVSLVVDTGMIRHRALAGPIATARVLLFDLSRGSLLGDIAATCGRVGAGVALGMVSGAAVGLLLGVHARRRAVVEPGLDFLRAVPPLLVFSLLLLALGYGETARVLSVAFTAALTVSLHVATGLANIAPSRLQTLHVMGASWLAKVRYLYVYEMLPVCLPAARQAISTGLVVAVVTEMLVGADAGLGTRALDAQISYDAPRLYGVIVVTGLLGQLASHALLAAEGRLRTAWR